MPRVTLSADEQRWKELHAVIKKYMALRGCASDDLALAIGVSRPTYFSRMKNLDSLSLAELRRLKRRLAIPAEEISFVLK